MSWRKPGEHVGSGDAFERCVREIGAEYEHKIASGTFKPRKPLPRGLTLSEKADYIAERTCAKIGMKKYGKTGLRAMASEGRARHNPSAPPAPASCDCWSPAKIVSVGAALTLVAYGAVTMLRPSLT